MNNNDHVTDIRVQQYAHPIDAGYKTEIMYFPLNTFSSEIHSKMFTNRVHLQPIFMNSRLIPLNK